MGLLFGEIIKAGAKALGNSVFHLSGWPAAVAMVGSVGAVSASVAYCAKQKTEQMRLKAEQQDSLENQVTDSIGDMEADPEPIL